MKIHSKFEKGQAIVLIALAMVGLFGLVALAIDGGNAFADRRQAQNAADAAALAAAMRYGQDQSVSDSYLSNLVLQRTSSNGYNNTAPRSTVTWSKTSAGADCPNGSIGYYFQVNIDSYNPTWFGGVVGVSQVHNAVSAKAIGCSPYLDAAFEGNAVVVVDPTNCQSLNLNGGFQVVITSTTGNGVFVNSNNTTNCPNLSNNGAFYFQNGYLTSPTVNVVGTIFGESRIIVPPTVISKGVPPIQRFPPWPPVNQVCPWPQDVAHSVYWQNNDPNTNTLTPGLFPVARSWSPQTFPPAGNPPGSPVTFLPGTYCLDGANFKSLNSDTLTGDLVTFVLVNSTIDIPGGTIHLTAPIDDADPLKGLLFYSPKSNPKNYFSQPVIAVNGNGDSVYTGSIVAPFGIVKLNGGGSTRTEFNCQVIAWDLLLTGNGILNLNYEKDLQWRALNSSAIGLIR